MGRALSAPLALILFTLTCALSVHSLLPNSSKYSSGSARQNSRMPDSSQYSPRSAQQNSLLPASMKLLEIHLVAGHCCNHVCRCAEVDNATAEYCGAIEDRVAALSPSLCASDSRNSSSVLCPPSGAGIPCNGGPNCCTDVCNEPCTSKLDVCVCPCKHCSTCSCCMRVENRACQLRCTPCDKVLMMLDFQDQHGKPHSVNISRNFSLNSGDAEIFYSTYLGRRSIIGFFEPDDPNIVHVSNMMSFLNSREDYPVASSWAEFGAFTAFPIFTVGVILTGLLIALLLQKMRRADQRPFRITWSVNRGLWIGIIWPLIILLLVLQVRHPVLRSDITLSILFPQVLACIGWLPLLLLWLYHIIHPRL